MPQLDVLSQLKRHFCDPNLSKHQVIQNLWSGYGEIARYISPKLNQSFIVKQINHQAVQNHPRGWNTDTGHQRKLKSYVIEGTFYQQYAELCDQHCTVPGLLAAFSDAQHQVLVLTDLDSVGFAKRKTHVTLADIELGIKWLACFHGRFLNHATTGLWPIGTYWHLATRQDELAAMADCPLKHYAGDINCKLNRARFQTCVHGDAKLANFCFPDIVSEERLAAVDFQYVGKGVGVKDLAYFLGSCMNSADLHSHGESMLDKYFSDLRLATKHYNVAINVSEIEQEWRALYPFVWADFHRFLLGWSPEHFKINHYMQTQTDLALQALSNKF